jgi:pimeloyl-ACP methyl ester carboxylesterase
MRTTLAASLILPALAAAIVTCDAQQPTAASTAAAANATNGRRANATIILVHGAFADGSSWQEVIPLLQQDGYKVIAVQNPLISLENDVATTKRVIDAQSGPVVVVGHSYGGAVISGAAAGSPNVKALVYVAAFAPEVGEPVAAFLEKYPSDLGTALLPPDAAGFLYINPDKFHDVFAADIPLRQTRVVAATQKPIAGASFGASNPVAAWKLIPSWYLVTTQDRAINPDLERFYAKRMGAKTTEIKSSHVPFISHPRTVAKLIVEAANAAP